MTRIIVNLLTSLLIIFSMSSPAEIHKWKDENGKLHFSDAPPLKEKSEILDENELANRISSVSIVTVKLIAVEFSLNRQTNMLTMYSTTRCGYCQKARRYFQENNIEYVEKNVDRSSHFRKEFKRLGGGGVPLFLAGRYQMRGFSEKRFKWFYDKLRG